MPTSKSRFNCYSSHVWLCSVIMSAHRRWNYRRKIKNSTSTRLYCRNDVCEIASPLTRGVLYTQGLCGSKWRLRITTKLLPTLRRWWAHYQCKPNGKEKIQNPPHPRHRWVRCIRLLYYHSVSRFTSTISTIVCCVKRNGISIFTLNETFCARIAADSTAVFFFFVQHRLLVVFHIIFRR